MATIEERLQNVRTLEDIVYLLNILFTNLNNQNKIYYDMFLNPTPMYIDLERYDENGVLGTIPLPNRAMDRILILTGSGDPNGNVSANIGTMYLDLDKKDLYVKVDGDDTTSSLWTKVYSTSNFTSGQDYLAPNGDGSGLENLNTSQLNGVLGVAHGGTGTEAITNNYLVQGHGQDPFTSFNLDDISSLLADMVGMIMWCPYSFENPSDLGRWLICDGTEYDISIRPELTNLFNKLGSKYGGDGITTFKVPPMIGRYIKGGSVDDENFGKEVAGSVMKHTHSLSNSETAFESSHTHGPGNLDVKSNQSFFDIQVTASHIGGAFTYGESVSGKNAAPGGENDRRIYLKLQGNWNQNTKTGSGSSHKHALVGNVAENNGSNSNEVDHIVMVPVIRY